MFDFLNFNKTNDLVPDIELDPEIIMTSLDNGLSVFMRISSGDALNGNKSIQFEALAPPSELSLHIEKFSYEMPEKLKDAEPHFVIGDIFIKQQSLKEPLKDPILIKLVSSKVAVYPRKVKENKKTVFLFPSIEAVQAEIEETWTDEFSKALADLSLVSQEPLNSFNRKRKSYSNEGYSLTTKICIGLIILSVAIFGYSKFIKNNQVQSEGKETILGVYDEINKLPEHGAEQAAPEQQKTADQEAMQEFGLEEGVKLE